MKYKCITIAANKHFGKIIEKNTSNPYCGE